MSKNVSAPNRGNAKTVDPLADVRSQIQERFGVTLDEYTGVDGKRTEEVQKKIDLAMQKETLQVISKAENLE